MDFGSFENTIDKNIETDKTSDKFDQQLQAYKDASNTLTSAKSELKISSNFFTGKPRTTWLKPPIKRTLLQKPLIALLPK